MHFFFERRQELAVDGTTAALVYMPRGSRGGSRAFSTKIERKRPSTDCYLTRSRALLAVHKSIIADLFGKKKVRKKVFFFKNISKDAREAREARGRGAPK